MLGLGVGSIPLAGGRMIYDLVDMGVGWGGLGSKRVVRRFDDASICEMGWKEDIFFWAT